MVKVPAEIRTMPGGAVQGFGEQLVPAPSQVLGEMQAACVVTVHVPAVAQQEPVVGGCVQGFGVQTPPSVQVSEQTACVVTVQVPTGAQQEPVTGGCSVPMPLQPIDSHAVAPRLTAQDCKPALVGANRTVTIFSWFAVRE
jgi:hypothetical protein